MPMAAICGDRVSASAQARSRSPWATWAASLQVKEIQGGKRGGLLKGAQNGQGFFERRDGFEGDEIDAGIGENGKALGVEDDQVVEADRVEAVVFRSVVEGRAVGAERGCDPDAAGTFEGIEGAGLLGDLDRVKEGGGGSTGGVNWFGSRRLGEFAVAERGDLVACGRNAVGSGAEIVKMNGGNG